MEKEPDDIIWAPESNRDWGQIHSYIPNLMNQNILFVCVS